MTKIGIFTDHTGGVPVFSTRLAGQLKDYPTCEIHTLTYFPSTSPERAAVEKLRCASHAMHFIPRSKNDAALINNIHSALEDMECDVFIPNYRYTTYAALARLSRHTTRVKVIGLCHDDDESYYGLLEHYEGVIAMFICPSLTTRSVLTTRIPARESDIRYLPHGVPLFDGGEPCYSGGALKLVYSGRMEESQKRVSYLLAIAGELERRSIPFALALIGDGPDKEHYRQRAAGLGLSARVRFHGHLDPGPIGHILRESHLALLVSKHEGFCLGLAEAMGAGLPAIAFSCGGVVEQYLKDGVNGYVVPWGDVAGAVDRIAEFYQNTPKWSSFSKEARNEIRTNYSMAAFARGYMSLFDEVLTGIGRPRCWPFMRPALPDRNRATVLTDRLGKSIHLW